MWAKVGEGGPRRFLAPLSGRNRANSTAPTPSPPAFARLNPLPSLHAIVFSDIPCGNPTQRTVGTDSTPSQTLVFAFARTRPSAVGATLLDFLGSLFMIFMSRFSLARPPCSTDPNSRTKFSAVKSALVGTRCRALPDIADVFQVPASNLKSQFKNPYPLTHSTSLAPVNTSTVRIQPWP